MAERETQKDHPAATGGSRSQAADALWKGRYRIEKELGRGGFGVVYLARDEQLHSKPVVLKVLQDESNLDPYFQKKFQQEIEALARIDHPGVVGVLDVGESPEGKPFLVMQFVEGVTLRSEITKDGMDFRRVAHILRQVGQALGAAHDKGVYHRDLKPENIMLQRSSETEEYVKLIDFGVAAVRDSQVAAQTQPSKVVGTLSYMAPEQVLGKGSASSDIYSLGVISFEMLSGQRPEVTWEGVAKRPRELRLDIPEAAQEIILSALSYQPEKRLTKPREFGDQMARALGAELTITSPLPAVPVPAPAAQQSSSAGLEMAYVLFMDIVAYSKMPMDLQSRRITDLVNIVRDTAAFKRAQQSDQIISLPTGDGMALVFFQNPASPVECATEVSRALKTNPDIKLRMGVHTGPVYRIADINTNRNVAGGGINLAQRVMDCGDAGHILVSKTVADILGQLSDWEPLLHDLGEAEVKHGVKVNLVNFYTSEVGNPALPEKLRKSAALPVPAPPAPAPAPQYVPQAPPPKSNTGLILGGVGAVVVLMVVVGALKFGPWNKGPEPAQSGATPSQSSFGPLTPGAIPPAGTPPASPPAVSAPAPEPAPPSQPSAKSSQAAAAPATPQPQAQPAPGSSAPSQPGPRFPLQVPQETGEQVQVKQAPGPASQPTPSAADRTAQQEARERMLQLTARAVAVSRAVSNMEQQQARQGVGMRADMSAARAGMEFLMGEAKTAVEARDFDTAKRNMDLAERQIEKLEGFLGR